MPAFDPDIRKLIISQLNVIDRLISELGAKVDCYHQYSQQLTRDIATHDQTRIASLSAQIGSLEIRAKIWGAVIGFIAGFIAAHVVEAMLQIAY